MKNLIIIAILYQAASYVQAQDINDYDTESKTEWSNGWETDDSGNVTKMCKEDCDRVCVQNLGCSNLLLECKTLVGSRAFNVKLKIYRENLPPLKVSNFNVRSDDPSRL